ncbi:MAG TPA: cytochrome C assembly protein [Chloroflexi bacterium]|nr:MAG: cytochrome C assembly protein [Chloroflexota bacterium]HDD55696.1 cytochrome C assembly protein [Chloroflexota bacterium]
MKAKPRLLTALDILSFLMVLTAAGLVFYYAPVEKLMGAVQKVFYFHVATAWVGMLGFLVAAAAGIFYLRRGEEQWDIVGVSAVEISLVFFLIAIIMGSIWARPIWNTWWTWDPRLTTASIVELIYAAYMLLRSGVDDPERRARFSAIYALFGFISVPLTFISIRLLRTIHPIVIGSAEAAGQGGFNMDAPMKMAFFFSLAAFSVFFADLLWHRIRLGELKAAVESLRVKSFQEEK